MSAARLHVSVTVRGTQLGEIFQRCATISSQPLTRAERRDGPRRAGRCGTIRSTRPAIIASCPFRFD